MSTVMTHLANSLVGMAVPSFRPGTTPPTGFLFCDGSAVSRATYSRLFDVIGTTYGAGDGVTTFNLPDCRGRVLVGRDDMGGSAASRLTNSGTGNPGINGATLGATGGVDRHTLTTAQMPAHTHDGNGMTNRNTASGGTDQVLIKNATANALAPAVNSTGGGEAHPNVQPSIVINWFIKF